MEYGDDRATSGSQKQEAAEADKSPGHEHGRSGAEQSAEYKDLDELINAIDPNNELTHELPEYLFGEEELLEHGNNCGDSLLLTRDLE
jgi:hypothetical protein